ncbi:MAG: hypothetical protein ACRYGP_13690 [Janthinobacterium lividum]
MSNRLEVRDTRFRLADLSTAIGTTLPFERLSMPLLGKPAEHFGEVTIVADVVTWHIVGIQVFEDGFSFWPRPGTELFDKLRATLHQLCGDDINERLNSFVEERGGYHLLFGQAIPANPVQRCSKRFMPASDGRIVWIDAA